MVIKDWSSRSDAVFKNTAFLEVDENVLKLLQQWVVQLRILTPIELYTEDTAYGCLIELVRLKNMSSFYHLQSEILGTY